MVKGKRSFHIVTVMVLLVGMLLLGSFAPTFSASQDDTGGASAAGKGEARQVTIQLVPGRGDTAESWFKIAKANLIADKLIAEGKARPCILTTANVKGAKQLKADDYKTWAERRQALIRLISK